MSNLEFQIEIGNIYEAWNFGWKHSKFVVVIESVPSPGQYPVFNVTDGESIWSIRSSRLFNLGEAIQPSATSNSTYNLFAPIRTNTVRYK